MTLPFQPTTASGPWVYFLSMPGTAPPIRSTATNNLFVSIRELPLLSSMPSYTIKSAWRESTEWEQNKPPVIWGTKASIAQGKIQEQLTFLNRTISSTGARYSDITYYTWHNKSILSFFPLYSLLCSLFLSPKVRKRLFETTKGPANGEKCGGRVNELATVIGMASSYEVTSNDNATDAHRKAGLGW